MSKRSRWSRTRLFGGWLSLFVHLLAVSGVAQAAVTFLAVMDGSHHIAVQAHGQATVLVLSHDEPDSVCQEAARHQLGTSHNAMLRAMLLLARPTTSEKAHLFALTGDSSQFSRVTDRLVDRPIYSTTGVEAPSVLEFHRSAPLSRFSAFLRITSLSLLAVDSIVLLI